MRTSREMTEEEFYDAVFRKPESADIGPRTIRADALRSAPFRWPELKIEAFFDRLRALDASGLLEGREHFGSMVAIETLVEAFDELEDEHISVIGEVSRHSRTCVPAEFCFCPRFDPAQRGRRLTRALRRLIELQAASVARLNVRLLADEDDEPDEPRDEDDEDDEDEPPEEPWL